MRKRAIVALSVLVAVIAALMAFRGCRAEPPWSESAAGGPVADAAPPVAVADGAVVGDAAATRVELTPADTPDTGSLWIQVLWSDGTPAPDVAVYVESGLAFASRLPEHGERTDANGVVRIPAFRSGPIEVRADRAGQVSAIVRRGQETRVTLRITAGIDIEGLVEDDTGAPVPDAQIWLTRDPSGTWRSGRVVARSDAAGRFQLRDVPPAQSIGAIAAGRAPSAFADLELMDTGASPVWVVLRLVAPGGRLVGTVVDHLGGPVVGAQIAIGETDPPVRSLTEDPRSPRTEITDEAGRFVCEGLAPGDHPVEVWAAGRPGWRGRTTITAAATTELEIRLAPGATITGNVRDTAGKPLRDVLVMALPSPTPGNGSLGHENRTAFRHPSALSDADGAYRLTHVAAGEAHLFARSEGRGSGGMRPFAVASVVVAPGATERWDPVLDAGLSIEGVVRTPAGAPVVGAVITVRSENGKSFGAFTDSVGAFAVCCLRAGDHELTVRMLGRLQEPVVRRRVQPGAGRIDIVVEEPAVVAKASVSGRVLDAGQRLIAGLRHTVALRSDSGSTTADLIDQRFAFTDVEPGRYHVAVLCGDDCVHVTPPFVVEPGVARLLDDVVTVAGGSLIVELERQGPTTGREVRLQLTGTTTGTRIRRTHVQGLRERFDNLTPDRWLVELDGRVGSRSTNCASDRCVVEVTPAATQTCRLVVQPGVVCELRVQYPPGHTLTEVLWRDDGSWRFRHGGNSTRSGGPGSSYWLSVPAGRVLVEATTEQGARGQVQFVAAEGDVAVHDLRLQ